MNNYYKRFKELREKANLSQQEVADALEVNRASISAIETGNRKLSFLESVKFGKFLEREDDLKDLIKYLGKMSNEELDYYNKLIKEK